MENIEDKVLQTVIEGLQYAPLKDVLIKPLEPIKITKEVTEAVGTGKKDVDGYEKFETKTQVKEVESDWRLGIVLAIPASLKLEDITVGDTIVYNKKFAMDFDLFKNSQLVKSYDIVAKKIK